MTELKMWHLVFTGIVTAILFVAGSMFMNVI